MLKFLLVTLLTSTYAYGTPTHKTIEFDYDKSADPYYQVTSVHIQEIENEKSLKTYDKAGFKSVIMTIDSIIAIGKKVWPIIEAGKPVVDVDMSNSVSVIPKSKDSTSDDSFYHMENWSAPKVRSYKVDYKNGFGSTVISFTYSVMFQHSGTYENKGKYLAGINVVAKNVNVAWGFDFAASSQLVQISNHGTKTDHVAGATFKVSYVAKSVLKEIRSSDTFHVMGNGSLTSY